MAYDKNHCTFSGKIQDIKRINTQTGTPMASCCLHCWKENIRCVGFKGVAGEMLSFNDGDRVLISGKIQSSNWEKDGVKIYSYQVIVDEIKADTEKQAKQRSVIRPRQPESRLNEYDYQGGSF